MQLVRHVLLTSHALDRYRERVCPQGTSQQLTAAVLASRPAEAREYRRRKHQRGAMAIHEPSGAAFVLLPVQGEPGTWSVVTVLHQSMLSKKGGVERLRG
jgi:hypothetical protein